MTVWSGQGKAGGGKRAEEKCNIWDPSSLLWSCYKVLEETATGFPSASQPLRSSPPSRVLILKLLKLFPMFMNHLFFFFLFFTLHGYYKKV